MVLASKTQEGKIEKWLLRPRRKREKLRNGCCVQDAREKKEKLNK
jgi:hypothetical protein